MPARKSSSLCPRGFNVDTHLLRRTTTLRSRWVDLAPLRARVAWAAGELPPGGEAPVRVETAEAGAACVLGAAGVAGAAGGGVDVTLGVTTGRTVAGGAAAVGGLTAGTVAVGGGVLLPGTVTVTGETAGAVADGFVVAAPLGRESMANTASAATMSRTPARIGRRATTSAERAATAPRW